MRFGDFPLADVAGGILAHSVRLENGLLKKGHRLTSADIARLKAHGVSRVMAALLDEGDILEDAAATRIASHITGRHITCGDAFTGRVNLHAAADGLVMIDEAAVQTLNHRDEAITLATVSPHALVRAGQLLATVKIIPLAVENRLVTDILTTVTPGVIALYPFHPSTAMMIQTRLNSTTERKFEKARRVMSRRLEGFNGRLVADEICPHEEQALAQMLTEKRAGDQDMILIMGASAITDRRDVIPAAIVRAGGEIIHYGMPVDPGNLMLVAKCGRQWILGLPGCARSPRRNGIDLILARITAQVSLTRADIMSMGVGGLLSEYPGRPQPRERRKKQTGGQKVAALILAAGQSSRMGGENKLLLNYKGKPILSHVIDEVEKAGISPIHMVTGHQRAEIESLAQSHEVTCVHNPSYRDGMSTSVKCGIASLPEDIDAVLILLGDMPEVTAALLARITAAYHPTEGRAIIIPRKEGRRGNPILWDRDFFDDFAGLDGDRGAKSLLTQYAEYIHEVDVDSDAIFQDIDTAEAYDRLRDK